MRLAIVTGICVERDAISAAVVSQAAMAMEMPGVESVEIFAQHIDRPLPCAGHRLDDPWQLLCHPQFDSVDVAIFHLGIRYPIFDAIIGMDHDRQSAVVHFHNITPVDLVDLTDRPAIEQSHRQLAASQLGGTRYWCCSDFSRQTLIDLGHDPARLDFVPFPVETLRPLCPRGGGETLELLSVGRLVPSKGTHTILEALAMARTRIDRPVHLRLVGNLALSANDYADATYTMIDDLGLTDLVTMEPDIDDQRLWECYESADVVVSASHHEGLCVPILEGYLAGCRAIGTTAGNLPYVVQAPDPVVEPGDAGALADAIVAVDADLRHGMAPRRDAVREVCLRYGTDSVREKMRRALDLSVASKGVR